MPQVPTKEFQGAVCSLCDGADLMGLFKVSRELDSSVGTDQQLVRHNSCYFV